MSKKYKLILAILISVIVAELVLLLVIYLQGSNFAVLNPKGIVGLQQRNLMIFATLLSLVVVIPVFALTFFIVWKYRAGNVNAKYSPDWDHNTKIEAVWWGVPIVLILILGVVTWNSSHALDPKKALVSNKKPVTVQVVALEWKWLFIYPEYNVASVNYLQFPEDTPVNFEITADAPMNSFWIPQLGGQIYAMSGMKTKLNLMASEVGDYNGSSANLSGAGFAGMKFTARASSEADFDSWVQSLKQSPDSLSMATYTKLAEPSKNNPPAAYASQSGLFDMIMMKYMKPAVEAPSAASQLSTPQMQGMEHDASHN